MIFIRFPNVDVESIFRNSAFDNRLTHYIHKYLQQEQILYGLQSINGMIVFIKEKVIHRHCSL